MSYIKLRNQSEHSGILIHLIENDHYLTTDSAGHINTDTLPAGTYSIEVRYPYFRSEYRTITIDAGVITPPLHLELDQILQYWIKPSETTV